MSEFASIPPNIWTKPRFKKLSATAKLLYCFLATSANTAIPVEMIALKLNLPLNDIDDAYLDLMNADILVQE